MTGTDNLPTGYHSVTPYFTVENADKLIAFLIAAFDACVIKENRTADNRMQHARVRIGNSIIMLNERSDTYYSNVSQMHLFVDDADRVYVTALACGAESLMMPNGRPHGDRMAGLKDPCGNIWWIATHRP